MFSRIHANGTNRVSSHQNPLTPPLNKLVQKYAHVCQDEAADVEAEELGSMSGAQFKTNLCFVSVTKSRVLNLACDLIYGCC